MRHWFPLSPPKPLEIVEIRLEVCTPLALAPRGEPVSYTHLDVYKRQGRKGAVEARWFVAAALYRRTLRWSNCAMGRPEHRQSSKENWWESGTG